MKSLISLIGILLIIFGIAVLGYQGITYTKREKIAQVGDIQVTADTEKTIYFSPLVGGLSLIAGVILLVIRKKQ
jgi:hypothetical protein